MLNIATGLVPPPDVAKSLLTAKEQGQKATNDFIDHNLASDEKSFWTPVTKMKLKTSASLSKLLRSAKSKEKQVVINADRQLWNRLAIASKSRDIDFKDVLSYELSSVPLSLSTLDSSLRKPIKTVLLHEIEIERETVIERQQFQGQTVTILDLMASVQSLTKEKKTTFGHLSDVLIMVVLSAFNYGNLVHVVADRYDTEDSIKSGKRARRAVSKTLEVKIKGRETQLPSNIKKFLMNNKNKSNLIAFLMNDWCEKIPPKLTNNQSLDLGQENGNVKRITRMAVTDVEELECDHEEADSRMFIHAHYAAENENAGHVIITSPDTDVAVLCLFHSSTRKEKVNSDARHSGKLSEEIIRVLIAFHTLTGCDPTSAPFGCGKKVAYCTLKGNIERFKELSDLGASTESSNISEELVDTAIKFICSLYDQKNRTRDINS